MMLGGCRLGKECVYVECTAGERDQDFSLLYRLKLTLRWLDLVMTLSVGLMKLNRLLIWMIELDGRSSKLKKYV
jgi:hypothetical protein